MSRQRKSGIEAAFSSPFSNMPPTTPSSEDNTPTLCSIDGPATCSTNSIQSGRYSRKTKCAFKSLAVLVFGSLLNMVFYHKGNLISCPSCRGNQVTSTQGNKTLKNKTLVIIWGNLRCGEKAWKTLYKNVLDVNHADLALLLGETRDTYQNATLFQRAKYVWSFSEYDNWADAIDEINGTAWRTRLIPLLHKKSTMLGGMQVNGKNYHGSGAVGMTIRWYLMQRIQNLGLLNEYERFVITRSDHIFASTISMAWTPRMFGFPLVKTTAACAIDTKL